MNVANKTSEILDKLEESGFNGVRVEYIERESIWHKEYSIFVIRFILDTNFHSPTSEYHESYVRVDDFEDDFLTFLTSQFPRCTVTWRKGCSEIEILGPRYKDFYRKYADRLEILSDSPGHKIFVHDAYPAVGLLY